MSDIGKMLMEALEEAVNEMRDESIRKKIKKEHEEGNLSKSRLGETLDALTICLQLADFVGKLRGYDGEVVSKGLIHYLDRLDDLTPEHSMSIKEMQQCHEVILDTQKRIKSVFKAREEREENERRNGCSV